MQKFTGLSIRSSFSSFTRSLLIQGHDQKASLNARNSVEVIKKMFNIKIVLDDAANNLWRDNQRYKPAIKFGIRINWIEHSFVTIEKGLSTGKIVNYIDTMMWN